MARRERLPDSPVAPRLRAGPRKRIWVAWIASWRAASLDRELALDTSPRYDAVLQVRAQRITGHRGRKRVADGLARASRDAGADTAGSGAAVRPDEGEVLAASTVLAAVDRRLRAPDPVTAQGMAQLRLLLTDVDSPLYYPSEPGAFGSRLRAAAAALEPADRCARAPVTPAVHQEAQA